MSCLCLCSYEGLRKVVPGRPQSSCERRGALALLSDAALAIVCGGAAGMIMWSVVQPCLHGSALCASVLLVVCGNQKEGCSKISCMCPKAQFDLAPTLLAADAAAKHCRAAAASRGPGYVPQHGRRSLLWGS